MLSLWTLCKFAILKSLFVSNEHHLTSRSDPQVQKDFVDALYDGGPFLKSLPNAMANDGILVAQVGAAPKLHSPPEENSLDRNRVNFIRSLVDMGFESIRDYEEVSVHYKTPLVYYQVFDNPPPIFFQSHGGFEEPWQIIAAFKSASTSNSWFPDSPAMQRKIRQRITPTADGSSSLRYFDGATMMSYSKPSRASEAVFCRRAMKAPGCTEDDHFANNKVVPELNAETCSLLESVQKGGSILTPPNMQELLALCRLRNTNKQTGLAHAVYNPARERAPVVFEQEL